MRFKSSVFGIDTGFWEPMLTHIWWRLNYLVYLVTDQRVWQSNGWKPKDSRFFNYLYLQCVECEFAQNV